MTNIFFAVFLVTIVGLFGSLLYLIYLPFKNRLKKSGKLTDKLSRQINWAFILLLCLASVLLYCLKDNRTPSKDRLENISNIKLPNNYIVIKDEYQDMLQDYCIYFDIQYDNEATLQLIESIKSSKFYNPNLNSNTVLCDSSYVLTVNGKTIWYKSINGYHFNKLDGLTTYDIDLDTLTYILKYAECAD